LPTDTSSAPLAIPGPTHLTHPMAPATKPSGVSSLSNSPVRCPEPSSQCLASLNWGGYAVCAEPTSACSNFEAIQGSVTYVAGTWTVPRITTAHGAYCSDQENTWYDSSVWVGIDGLFSSSVEQTGTSSDCFYGQTSYYAWFEFYPAASETINFTVNGGDVITASVSCAAVVNGSNCSTTLTDLSNSHTYTSSTTFVPGALMDSAEWIQESAYYDGFLALTPTTPVNWLSTSATINGVTHSISGWGANVYWLVMVTYNFPYVPVYQQSSMVKGEPSALSRFGTFTSSFVSSGP